MKRRVLALLVGGGLAAVMAVVAVAQDHDTAPATTSPAAEAQRRYDEVRGEVGHVCTLDGECPAPLRCGTGACIEPGAMVGGADADTPSVLFYAQGGEVAYYVELVDDRRERARGLMYRPSMLPDWGMLFLYPSPRPLSFWMQNTFIPLDMVFIGGDGVVVGVVENAEPLTTTSRSVPGESQFVLELNAGQAAEHGIGAGVRTEFLNVPAEMIHSADGD